MSKKDRTMKEKALSNLFPATLVKQSKPRTRQLEKDLSGGG